MSKVWLVSALVEKPGAYGHRARVAITENEDEALGSSLKLFQVNGWNVISYDISACNVVIPNPGHENNR